MALLYLTFLGSIVTLSAYTYLLENVRPALATSYAYVNPVVAVVLGVTVGSEVLSGEALIALPLILAGVGLVAAGRSRTVVPETGAPTTGKLPA
jgi:drug/metabolite transporter (DMT)-like permease